MRMYHLVMYNLSPIQKGIQAGHAALEYANMYGQRPEYQDFIQNHKTWIILDAGGSQETQAAAEDCYDLQIPFSIFREPDLNNAVSAISFLVPERVYSGKFEDQFKEDVIYDNGERMSEPDAALFKFIKQFRLAR